MTRNYFNQLPFVTTLLSRVRPALLTFAIVANGLFCHLVKAEDVTGVAPRATLESSHTTETLAEEALGKLEYGVHYVFTPNIKEGVIDVELQLSKPELVKSISFRHDKQRHKNFSGDGKLKRFKSSIRWEPGTGDDAAVLRYQAKVSHERNKGGFDALMTADWSIFRGDNIVPTAKVRSRKGASSVSTLSFDLPPEWTSVDIGWRKMKDWQFRIDNPERQFDRPTGWMIAGKLGSRRDFLQGTELSIAAPQGSDMQRMNALALINLVWPEVQRAFQKLPPKILIVAAGDPMWRGGLSSPNSFYVHAGRPLISENGTSTLLHELSHVITRIRGSSQSDWISEGLAEFYSIELMLRAGAMNPARHNRVLKSLARWGAKVDTLRTRSSSGATTARAVLLIHQLDIELRKESNGQYSIDDVTRQLMVERKVSNKKLRTIVETLLGRPSQVLATPLLR
ncbi:MAG: hypothetical protein AB8B86_10770 [Pseudomonadales bacterium]